jgi:LmbE family N-acetylglucosaminyl deacetylase
MDGVEGGSGAHMLTFSPALEGTAALKLLCIGAHSDDLEIGCGGTLLSWLESSRPVHVTWVVLTAAGERAREARRSATALLRRAAGVDMLLGDFKDGFLPSAHAAVKEFYESVAKRTAPDIILTHRLEDRHQDHRLAGELTWNTWRDHAIFEYEVPKYEGDLGQPNVFVPLNASTARRKAAHLARHFASQRSKAWFSEENFLALARLRGLECRSPSGLAEAFHARKMRLAPP